MNARPTSWISWYSLTGAESVCDQIDDTIRALGLMKDEVSEHIHDWVPDQIDAALPAGVSFDCEYPESLVWDGEPERSCEIQKAVRRIDVPRLIAASVQGFRCAGTLLVNGAPTTARGFTEDRRGGFYLAEGRAVVGAGRDQFVEPLRYLPWRWAEWNPSERFLVWRGSMAALVPKDAAATVEWEPAPLPTLAPRHHALTPKGPSHDHRN
jgi:hypothetical protein